MLGPGATLRVDIPEGLSMVVADPTMINEVLGILVDNAAHAVSAGGEILVQASHAVVSAEANPLQLDLAPGAYVVMRVIDNGVGMDEDTRSRALEPFFSTRVSLGGGLGLPTAYGLVRQSGGLMQIDSAPGAGTTVDVYLRVADLAALRTAAGGAQDEPRRGRQASARDLDMVLLLDPDQPARTRTAEILIRNNFQVVEARDGAEALRLAVEEQARIKLLIIDRVMGSMLDIGLPEMLQSLLPGARLILTSSLSRSVLSSQGLDDPSLPFLSKDCTEQQLLETVGEVVYGMTPRPRS